MLISLYIENILLITKINIDFSNGFTVITGETGAGKSIILDSLGIVLGDRALQSYIKNGEERGIIIAEFKIAQNQDLRAILNEHGINIMNDNHLCLKKIM